MTVFFKKTILFILLIPTAGWFLSGTGPVDPAVYQHLHFRHIGPPGNRTSAVIGIPGDLLTYYIGASSGGIWKSEDGGTHWEPVFDRQPAQSIGALAVAPSRPGIVWAGTGEAFVRSNISIGNGVYKSIDGGRNWTHMGLTKSGRIGRVLIHPDNPEIVWVAAMGHCYGPQEERGVFKTTDGGKSWKQVLFVDENTGCFEIALHPDYPQTLFAGLWPLTIKTWGRESGGPNGGIYRSDDGGDTWIKLTEKNGLPGPPLGKIGLAIAPSNPEVVYALIETGHPNRGVLWRSKDRGSHFELVSYDRILNERPHYASRVMVNPADENEVYFAANSQSRSLDGGYTTEQVPWSGDCHDMWADPLNPDRMMISDDAGAIITLNRGKTWRRIKLPVAQMYHVAVDNQIPYYVYGGKQDGVAHKGPYQGGEASIWAGFGPLWEATAGGECGYIVPDPVNPDIVWGGSYNSMLERADYSTGHIRTAHVWPESIYGSSAADIKLRFNWTFPIHISPHDHNRVYVGSQFVHVTENGGKSWEIISPDLSTGDVSKMQLSGGLTKDNIGVEYCCLVFAIAESPLEKGCIWAGTNDGLVHITRDNGKNWTQVTENIPGLPLWGTVSNILPSRHHAPSAYLTVDFHQVNNRDPHVYKTSNYGRSWKRITGGIPRSVFSYAHWIEEDPVRPGLLYLGTENALYVSFNDGNRWLPLQNNLPHAPVHHMVVQRHFNDLVVATYGRGFWILDDITPLQQLSDEILESDAFLFTPRPAYRFHPQAGGPILRPRAFIHYYLKEPGEKPVTVRILDGEGQPVRVLTGTAHRGINRVIWDVRHPGATGAQLRTKPPANPHVVEEKRFHRHWERKGWYPVISWGTWGGFAGFLASPGTYTVQMQLDGRSWEQPLTIRKDPNTAGTLEGIRATEDLQKNIRSYLNRVSEMISRIEWMRKQLAELRALLGTGGQNRELIDRSRSFEQKLKAVEDQLFQSTIAEGDSKSFRFPQKLYCKLSVLAGDVNKNVDFAPTRQQVQVFVKLSTEADRQERNFQDLLATDLPAFNEYLGQHGIEAGLIVPRIKFGQED